MLNFAFRIRFSIIFPYGDFTRFTDTFKASSYPPIASSA